MMDGLVRSQRSSRTQTGAWIETYRRLRILGRQRRTQTGAWIETNFTERPGQDALRRTQTGAWIETTVGIRKYINVWVAPKRVRGLKLWSK